MVEMFCVQDTWEYKLKVRDSRRRCRKYYPKCATNEHRPELLYRPRGSLRVVLK